MEGLQQNGIGPERGAEGGSDESRFDVRLYLGIIRKRLWVLLLVVAVALGVAFFVTSRMPRLYRSSSTVVVHQQVDPILGKSVKGFDPETQGWWQGTTFLKTQKVILESSKLARLAAEKLPPDQRAKLLGKRRGATISEEDLVRASRLIRGARQVMPGKDSRKFTISAVHTNPAVAAAIANAMTDAYLAYSLAQRQESSTVAERWLSERLDQLEEQLKQSEQKLQDFKRENGLLSVSLDDQIKVISNSVTSLNSKLVELMVKRFELSSKLGEFQRLRTKDPTQDPSPAMVDNEIINGLKKSYATEYQKLVALRGSKLEKHPKVQAQEATLETIRRDMLREVANQVKVLGAKRRAVVVTSGMITSQLAKTAKQAMALSEKVVEFRRLERLAKQTAKYYDMVLARYTESGLAKHLKTNNIKVLDRAVAPGAPFSPRLHVNLGVAFALGLLLGLGLIFLMHFMDNTVKGQEDIEHLVGLPYLGLLPSILGEQKARKGRHRKGEPDPVTVTGSPDLYLWANPHSQVAEHCRSIRTNLLFMSPDRPAKGLLVTSSVPREGKTTVAINIGISMAQSGEKTLIVDSDMRRPRVHKAFDLKKTDRGLSTTLVGESTLEESIQKTPIDNLEVLPCGPTPPNPAELLHTKRFREVVQELLSAYDRVVFDSPPVGAVTDPVILSKAVDGTILVVKSAVTARQLLARTKRVLSDVKANVLGCVLNDIDPQRRSYGGYYYYRYYKRGYYNYYSESSSDS